MFEREFDESLLGRVRARNTSKHFIFNNWSFIYLGPRERKYQKTEENCTMWSFMICTLG